VQVTSETIKYSLRFKFLLLISGMFITMAVVISLFFYSRAREHLHDKLVEKGTILVNDLAYNSTYGVSLGDAEILDILIQGVIAQPDISFVVIYDGDGKEMAFKDLPHVRWPLENSAFRRVAQSNQTVVNLHRDNRGEAYYEIMSPVIRKTAADASSLGPKGEAKARVNAIGIVRIGFSVKALNEELSSLLWVGLFLMLSIITLWIIIAIFFIRRIIDPITDMALAATKISAGDFTREVQTHTRDEVGVLGDAFNRMTNGLKKVIGKIREASDNVVATARQMGLSSNNVTEGTQVQARSIESISSSIEEINTSIREVARNIDVLSSAAEATSSSVLQMEASINEVAKNTGTLETSVEETSSAIVEMSSSIRQVAEHGEILSTSMERTLSAAQQIDASVSTVSKSAEKSAVLSGKVRDDAEKLGLLSVQKTIEGMENIRETMKDVSSVVNRLGERSEQIGGILTIIDEVTDQTSLLALNAAILAAQSGEHGRGFAVVAGEIKDLAERTVASTKEIADLIGDVQREVSEAIQLTKKGIDTVEEGVQLSNEADDVLRKILARAEESRDMATQIESATVEQAQGIRQVTEFMQQNSEMVHQIARATQEQHLGTRRIMEATEQMRDIAKIVRRAMVEQAKGSKQISETATSVSTRVQEIALASNEQTRESQKIIHSITEIQEITRRNVSVASEMAAGVNILARQSEILEEQIRNFKV
jgi:methyl-accepting chemotaxis protein